MANIFTDAPTQSIGSFVMNGHWDSARTCSFCGPNVVLVARFTYGYGSPTGASPTQEYNTVSGSHSFAFPSITKDRVVAFFFSGQEYANGCSCSLGSFINGSQIVVKSYADAPTFGAPSVGSVTQKQAINLAVTWNPKTNESFATINLQYKLSTSPTWIDGAIIASGQNGDSNRVATTNLSGLTPGTAYDFRFRVERDTENSRVVFSASGTFTTRPLQTVSTDAASAVGNTNATLNGTVNPQHASNVVSYYFEWGLTTAYGNVTATQGPSSGTSGIPYLQAIIGLVNNTTYHFRAVAVTAEATVVGIDRTFTTGAGAPTLTRTFSDTVTLTDTLTTTHIEVHQPIYYNIRIHATLYFRKSLSILGTGEVGTP